MYFQHEVVTEINMSLPFTMSVVYVINRRRVLLAQKARGMLKGCWCGYGGKCEPHESILDATVREVWEECGLRVAPRHLHYRGEFVFLDSTNCAIFELNVWSGSPRSTKEMRNPRWFAKDNLPHSVGHQKDREMLSQLGVSPHYIRVLVSRYKRRYVRYPRVRKPV